MPLALFNSKNIPMCSGTYQNENKAATVFLVTKQPIGTDVTFSTALKGPMQRMITILIRQRVA